MITDANFLHAYKNTIGNEGNTLSNNPNDAGRLTWKGISQSQNPGWSGWFLVKKHIQNKDTVSIMLKDTALENMVQVFYYSEFWVKLQCNKLTSQNISAKYFDTAVNLGIPEAVKIQQLSVRQSANGDVDNKLINALNNLV